MGVLAMLGSPALSLSPISGVLARLFPPSAALALVSDQGLMTAKAASSAASKAFSPMSV